MPNLNHNKAQAAIELAVFGAILIFLLGAIVRSAAGNSYAQDQNFKAMRMAMLASWQGSQQENISHNSASVMIIEDRLSPDIGKYGDLDRNPYIANGTGTFTYELLYPLDPDEVESNLPVMDLYINGQHFVLTLAQYFTKNVPGPDQVCPTNLSPCQMAQCLRNKREWVGGRVIESQFKLAVPITGTTAAERTAEEQANAGEIFTLLGTAPASLIGWPPDPSTSGLNSRSVATIQNFSQQWSSFVSQFEPWYEANISAIDSKGMHNAEGKIQTALLGDNTKIKLFYTMVPNNEGAGFPVPPADCVPSTSTSCINQALTADLITLDQNGVAGTWNGLDPTTGDHQGDMMFDLQRLANYTAKDPSPATSISAAIPAGVDNATYGFGSPVTACPATNMRCFVAWKWAATQGTSAAYIGLNTTSNQYPTYDIDGRLKEVTIFDIHWNPPTLQVSYEDMQAGDMDETWDSNSCGPKSGLQNNSQIFTFTENGTYLLIREGQLYNPETGQVVRSVNKRNSVDLIGRNLQLSNNTGRFCTDPTVTGGSTVACSAYCQSDSTVALKPGQHHCSACADTNLVEACVDSSKTTTASCLSSEHIAQTCMDVSTNMLYIRSRLQDLRGRFWMTNASGRLKVQ